MKPHTMLFDEMYSQKWYRSDEINEFLEIMDGLIVIGTALQTGKAALIVREAQHKNTVPIVEVNLESCIKSGYVL